MKKIVVTENAPKAIGPYSQAVEKNGMLFMSGQIPLDPLTGEIVGETAEEQAKQILKNMFAILSAAGYSFDDIVKTTIFLTNMNDFSNVNTVYSSSFNKDFPARSAVAVTALPKGVLVEIEAIAMK